ncbi:hypothetical protein CERZMDRAFT_95455 [Cercospora zeae-maydis SCOH1-5]|uniref:C3H1-type domain-containing protein n=1 Tax=Cercospora zeae-maydis SCOH1-5 TaxID=717836 RepID=A0A6A6FLD3_9PEZI|nr:hypothetical protein CERZMDRAFT_95455 [Cercospora zeae-maydis SCOH1-5]
MAKGICDFFEAGVKCPRAKCRYKHSAASTFASGQKRHNDSRADAPSTSRSNGASHLTANKDEFVDVRKKWLYCIPQDKRKSRPLGDKELQNFLALTLNLINSNADNMQRVISKLGGECGLMRVLEIIDRDFAAMNDDELESAVATLLMPCFRILSHEANEYVEVSIAVLASMIDRNRSAIANTSLQTAAKELVALLELENLSRANERHLRTIKTVMQLAIDLLEAHTNASRVDPGAPVATFTFAQDRPGALSALGPRHNNDSENI